MAKLNKFGFNQWVGVFANASSAETYISTVSSAPTQVGHAYTNSTDGLRYEWDGTQWVAQSMTSLTTTATVVFTYAAGTGQTTAQVVAVYDNNTATNWSPNDAGSGSTDILSAAEINTRIAAAIDGKVAKEPARMATTQDLELESFGASGVTYAAGVLTQDDPNDGVFSGVDGVGSPQVGQAVLVKDGPGVETGIYTITALGDGSSTPWTLTRRSDLEEGTEASGVYLPVEEGTINGDEMFLCTSDTGADVVGTDALTWTSWGALTDHEALTGLQGGTTGEHLHMTSAQHAALTDTGGVAEGGGQHHHDARYLPQAGTTADPNTVYTSRYAGDRYQDTSRGNTWVANDATNAAWTLVG
jgi:hypothetical protein